MSWKTPNFSKDFLGFKWTNDWFVIELSSRDGLMDGGAKELGVEAHKDGLRLGIECQNQTM